MRKMMVVVSVFALPLLGSSLAQADDAGTFKAKCGACHGADGKGKTKQGEKLKIRDMTTAEYKKEVTAEKIKKAINEGYSGEKDGVKQEMKSFKDKVPADQVDGLVKYVQELK